MFNISESNKLIKHSPEFDEAIKVAFPREFNCCYAI